MQFEICRNLEHFVHDLASSYDRTVRIVGLTSDDRQNDTHCWTNVRRPTEQYTLLDYHQTIDTHNRRFWAAPSSGNMPSTVLSALQAYKIPAYTCAVQTRPCSAASMCAERGASDHSSALTCKNCRPSASWSCRCRVAGGASVASLPPLLQFAASSGTTSIFHSLSSCTIVADEAASAAAVASAAPRLARASGVCCSACEM